MPRSRCDCRAAAKRLAEMGFSTAEIAKIFGVSERTARRWIRGEAERRRHPQRSGAPAFLDNVWVKLLRGRGR